MRYGLLGRKLGHSYSPAIHGMLGYDYGLFEREPEALEAMLKNEDFEGINVTIPYKKDVIPFLDGIDPLAQRLGAVNTIVKRNGKLMGYNSDYYGFQSMVRRTGIDVTGKKALVLGSGGASATACSVLEDLGSKVVVISRSGENNYGNLHLHADAALLVNTTPVGMYPNTGAAPVDISRLPALEGVLDVIYNPARTQLLLDSERLGIPGWNGLWMLVAQAVQSSRWFRDMELSEALVADIHRTLRDRMENIALIGMAGCGKSTVGRRLAQELGREFVDADTEIEKLAGKPIPRIFAEDGEDHFRRLETRALAALGKCSGLVIATGGGCVTREENYPLLHQNSRILWLRRDPEKLPTAGRPLSQAIAPATLYALRKPMYKAFADAAVDNDGSIDETLAAIKNILEVL